MNARRGLFLVLALAVVVVVLLVLRTLQMGSPQEPATVGPIGVAGGGSEPADADVPVIPVRGGRAALVDEEGTPTEVATAGEATIEGAVGSTLAPQTVSVFGRVVDVSAQPVAGASLAWIDERADVLGRSEADGTFVIELDPEVLSRRRTLVTIEPGWAHVRTSLVQRSRLTAEHLIVVAPAVEVAGSVLDEGGSPVAGARVDVLLTSMAGFPYLLETTRVARRSTTTGEDGAFRLNAVPTHRGFELRAVAAGHAEGRLPLPVSSRSDLAFVLARTERERSLELTGFVLHADGRPAASAKVQWGRDRTTSAEDGSFALQLRGGRAQRGPLVAFLVGFQGAVLHEVFPQYVDSGLSPPPVELVLGPPALTLEGEVWDASGAPCAGWRVSLLDGEEASVNRAPPVLVENLVADNDGTVESDEAGRFLLGGLSARDYTVRAFDPETLVQVRSKPVPAGSRVVLHVDEGAFRDQLAGRVVGFDGTPVADARVGLSICLGRSGPAASWWSGDSVATDELGRFRLRDVPRRDVYLSVHGDSVLSTRVELDEGAPDEGHTVEVIRRCRFRVSWAAAQPGDEFAMIDADEALLNVMEVRASSSSTRGTWRLEEGQSPPLSVSEQASAILLLREGKEVARAPVSLTPGELTVIRP